MLNLKLIVAIILFIGTPLTAHAAEIHTLSETTRLNVAISAHEINRISMQGDRIQQVFGADQSFSLETDEQSGQLFIKPLDTASRKAINLSIVTESGLTQDLRLTPQDIDAVSLILKSVGGKVASGSPTTFKIGPSPVDELIQLVQQTMQHKLSSIYNTVPCQPKDATHLWQYQPKRCWQGPHYRLSHYRLLNAGTTLQMIDTAQLAMAADVAIAVGRPTLKPDTATDLVVISEVQP